MKLYGEKMVSEKLKELLNKGVRISQSHTFKSTRTKY